VDLWGVTNVFVAVEPGLLKLDDLVLGLAHDVRDAVASIWISVVPYGRYMSSAGINIDT
jgi:hypothetical protein